MNKKTNQILEEAKRSIFIVPSVLLLVVFFVTPILLTVYYSFTNLALSGENARQLKFIGLTNYRNMFKDRTVRVSIINTLIFLLGSLIGQQVLGFIIAVLMKNKNRGFRGVIGPVFLAGWIMPEVVVALCCSTFFGDEGTLNSIFTFLHLPNVEFLYTIPMITVILANV
ncbi:MAG TPA: sugar ABC transporter permease, partial [Lachnospiraceae bacterium]|nr:sugar ABC transporter permease [Lachnospiraceae bacterium]